MLVTALALLLGHGLARGRTYARVLDGICVLGFVTPAALLGLGLMTLWNRPATQLVYASAAIIVLGYTARYAAIGVRTVAVSIAQAPAELEEAAAVSGARFFRRLRHIVVPLHARGLIGAWLLVLVFCLRDTAPLRQSQPARGVAGGVSGGAFERRASRIGDHSERRSRGVLFSPRRNAGRTHRRHARGARSGEARAAAKHGAVTFP